MTQPECADTNRPPLLTRPADFERIRNFPADSVPGRLRDFIAHTGEAMLPLPLLEEKLRGFRLLHVAREALKRISTWSLLYRLDGDRRWLERAVSELENICGFQSWNPRHFLDTAEMTFTAAIGLTWLAEEFDPKLQLKVRGAILEKGIQPSLDEGAVHNWWLNTCNNWNPVCHASLIAGAMALGDEHHTLANQIIDRALRFIPDAMDETLPDGVYPEGPAYWEFGTHYTVMAIEFLRATRGDAAGLDQHPTLFSSVHALAFSVSPGGNYYNFADSSLGSRFAPVLCWFAAQGDEIAAFEMHRTLQRFLESPDWEPDNDGYRHLAFAALWYPHAEQQSVPDPQHLPTRWSGRGINPIAIVREGFGDPRHFFFACKGGCGTSSHAHLDPGSFILEDQGVRWAVDLGMQDYHSLESKDVAIWDQHQFGDRWRIFRCGPYSHNLLLIDEQYPAVDGGAEITRFDEEGDQVHITVDLSQAHRHHVGRYTRNFTISANKRVQITDRIEGARRPNQHFNVGGASLHWRMATAAEIQVDGNRATLRQDGQTLHVRVLTPDTFTLRAQSLEQPPYWWDAPNPGITALDLWTHVDPNGCGEVSLLMSTDEALLQLG